MRELINTMEIIKESVGLANRKPGETFINPAGDLLTFIALNFYPTEGKFDEPDDMEELIKQIERRKRVKIDWVNKSNAGTLAFGIAEFKDSNNKLKLVGRFFSNISNIFVANFWPNSGLPDGFRYNKATAVKTQSGLMAQDVLSTLTGLTPDDILTQVIKKFGIKHPLSDITHSVVIGEELPVYIETSNYPDLSFSGFRDYFCEILQPVALINHLCSGNADEAERIFFGKKGFKTATITFDSGKNTGLFDSILTNSAGKEIKVSTKGGVGAAASVKNLADSIAEIRLAGNTELLTEFADVIEIVELAQKSGQSQAPLRLAERFGMISGKEATTVDKMRSSSNIKLTHNLQKIFNNRITTSRDPERNVPYYTMLAGIADMVASYINDNTNFSKAAAELLNNGALVQVYTKAHEEEGRFVLDGFNAVYPADAVAGVTFFAGKTYYNTGIKGNFTFKIWKKNGAPPSEEGEGVGSIADINAVTSNATKKIAKGGVKIRPPGVKRGTETSSTREKR